jgi:hypothetical protein
MPNVAASCLRALSSGPSPMISSSQPEFAIPDASKARSSTSKPFDLMSRPTPATTLDREPCGVNPNPSSSRASALGITRTRCAATTRSAHDFPRSVCMTNMSANGYRSPRKTRHGRRRSWSGGYVRSEMTVGRRSPMSANNTKTFIWSMNDNTTSGADSRTARRIVRTRRAFAEIARLKERLGPKPLTETRRTAFGKVGGSLATTSNVITVTSTPCSDHSLTNVASARAAPPEDSVSITHVNRTRRLAS